MSWIPIRSLPRIACAAAALTTLVLAGAAGITPATAATASGPHFGAFGMTPSPAASGQARSYFNLAIRPGQSVTDTVIVTNLSNRTERLQLKRSKGVTATNSGSAYENLVGRCTGPSCWVSDLPRHVVLAPRERRLVGFAVRVPRGVRPGQYLTGITLLAAKAPKAVRVGKHGHASAKAIIIDEVTVGVAVTVGNLSRLTSGLRVGQTTATWIGKTPRLNIPVRNTGQTFLRAIGKVRCLSGGHRHSYRVIMSTVLPRGRAVLPVNARGLQTGSFACTVRLRTSSGHLTRWNGTVKLASTVVTKTYHPVKGVYVSLPAQTIPIWAIALMVMGGLIVVALLLVLIQRRRVGASRAPMPDGVRGWFGKLGTRAARPQN